MKEIKVIRIYEHEQPEGYRILVDRLWPRGMSKVKAHLDEWDKEIGPTNELRKWFNHEDDKFPEFKSKYITQLKANPATPSFVKDVKDHLEKKMSFFCTVLKIKSTTRQLYLKNMLIIN